MYYNTTQLYGDKLKDAKSCSAKQEDRVLAFFRDYPGNWTPEDIWETVERKRCPLTSIRRALSDLTNDGYLTKTKLMKPGLYGKAVHTWTYKGDTGQETLF